MTIATSTTVVDRSEAVTYTKPKRLLSIDLLRGLTIAFMILVNDNGSSAAYRQLEHAAWNGFTFTDLVFPTFLFIVGISTVLSTEARLARGDSKQSLFMHALRRAVILILVGWFTHLFPLFHFETMRFYGVLPRIGVCYLVVATLYLISPKWQSKAVIAASLLVGYWILMRYVPVPGYGMPGRDIPLLDPDRNLAAMLDRHLFSAAHLYEKTRDPEGLLSTLPAIGTALLGMMTGIWLRTQRSIGEKIRGIALGGVSSVVLGLIWNLFFPINKKMWSSSYVLFAGGLSLLLLALSMWLFDTKSEGESKGKRSGWYTPLLVFGTNAIAAYVFADLLSAAISHIHVQPGVNIHRWLYGALLNAVSNASFASLLYSLIVVACCWLLVYVLYRRKIFIKI